MTPEIAGKPAFAHLRIGLQEGDRLIAESGAMASMEAGLTINTRWNGGFFRAIGRRLFGGESLFVNEFSGKGEVVLTQPMPGDMAEIDLRDTTLYLQPGAFIACEPGVNLGLGWAGFTSWIAREGLFRMKVSGQGRVWFGAYGGLIAREIEDELVVDSGHLVAYEPSIRLKLGLAGGIFSSFFSGEGLITRVRGPGRVYLQSRSFSGLQAWTNAHLH
mgnify:CR=1 FL=1